jgi:hypothetical protein
MKYFILYIFELPGGHTDRGRKRSGKAGNCDDKDRQSGTFFVKSVAAGAAV